MKFTWEAAGEMQVTPCRRYAIRNNHSGNPAWTAWATSPPMARDLGGFDCEADARAACELDLERALLEVNAA